MLLFAHVDKINKDQTTNATKSDLSCNELCCLTVGGQEHLLLVTPTALTARVDIKNGSGLSVINADIATARQVDLM